MAFIVAKYKVTSPGDGNLVIGPKDWTLLGSNNGTDWVLLDTVVGAGFVTDYQELEFTCDVLGNYRRHKLDITKNLRDNGPPGDALHIAQIKLGDNDTEDLTPTMTDANVPSPWEVTSSAQFSDWYGWKAFDGNPAQPYCGLNAVTPDDWWIEIDDGVNPTHILTATTSAHGSISPSGAVAVDDGDGQSFTFTPDENYIVGDVKVDSVSVGSPDHYDFVDVITEHTIDVTFVPSLAILSVVPDTAWTGEEVTLVGNGFGTFEGAVTFYDGVVATVVLWSNTEVVVTVPAGAETGDITVVIGEATLTIAFTISTPVVTNFSLGRRG